MKQRQYMFLTSPAGFLQLLVFMPCDSRNITYPLLQFLSSSVGLQACIYLLQHHMMIPWDWD